LSVRAWLALLLGFVVPACGVSETTHNAALRDVERLKASLAAQQQAVAGQAAQRSDSLAAQAQELEQCRQAAEQARVRQEELLAERTRLAAQLAQSEASFASVRERLEGLEVTQDRFHRNLQLELFRLLEEDRLQLERVAGRSVIRLPATAFVPKKVGLSAAGEGLLMELARVLAPLPEALVLVVGQAPGLSLASGPWPRSWRLACSRAGRVARRLGTNGVPAAHFAISCRAPLASDPTPAKAGRSSPGEPRVELHLTSQPVP